MRRLPPRAVEPASANGYVLKTIDGAAQWVEDPPPVLELGDLTDVDTSAVAPVEGDTLTWDSVGGFWKPTALPEPPEPPEPQRMLVPWTTVTSVGEPVFMWDDDNNLMMIEES